MRLCEQGVDVDTFMSSSIRCVHAETGKRHVRTSHIFKTGVQENYRIIELNIDYKGGPEEREAVFNMSTHFRM